MKFTFTVEGLDVNDEKYNVVVSFNAENVFDVTEKYLHFLQGSGFVLDNNTTKALTYLAGGIGYFDKLDIAVK